VSRQFQCSAEDVFAVLADGWVYPVWVVGASRMRAVDDGWPGVGSRLHHSAGAWPLLIDDTSEVLEYQPPRTMVLQARGWPAGEARVEITVEPSETGCQVSIAEDASSGPALLVPAPVRHALIAVRNQETLRRLAYLAEGHARS
jgi:Polyketide cyclase / dehydrase and lipid transport